ncbi:acyl-CoA carboxylase epsilon subunit [Streptomyces sp. NPDC014006]|uniref:acyl-CoA carboxylase epsilon subunit n=1 Tax=Streptomyces sp. NPDC014006 TaxID=3364870 RepID=UPI0036F6AA7A
MSAEAPRPTPTVRLVRGSADADELAAVLAVLHAVAARRAAAPVHPPAPARAAWTRPRGHPAATTWRTGPATPPR